MNWKKNKKMKKACLDFFVECWFRFCCKSKIQKTKIKNELYKKILIAHLDFRNGASISSRRKKSFKIPVFNWTANCKKRKEKVTECSFHVLLAIGSLCWFDWRLLFCIIMLISLEIITKLQFVSNSTSKTCFQNWFTKLRSM